MLFILSTISYAAPSDYSTIEILDSNGMAKITVTGVVGMQVGENTSAIAWIDEYGDDSLTSIDVEETIKALPPNCKILPIVEGGTVTTTSINGASVQIYAGKFMQEDWHGRKRAYGNLYDTADVFYGVSSSVKYTFSVDEHKVNINGDHMVGASFMTISNLNAYPSGEDVFTCTISEEDAKILLAKKQAEADGAEEYESASVWAVKELMAAEAEYLMVDSMSSDFQNDTRRIEFSDLIIELPRLLASNHKYDDILIDQQRKLLSKMNETVTREDLTDAEIAILDVGTYSDMPPKNKNIAIAARYGIITGVVENGYTYFKPYEYVTRQELCTMIVRALRVSGVSLESSDSFIKTYEDEDEVSSWALENMKILNNYGIYNGSGMRLLPKDTVDKQTAMLLVYRTLKIFKFIDLDNQYDDALIPAITQALKDEKYERYEAEFLTAGFNGLQSVTESTSSGDYTAVASDITLEDAPAAEYVTISYKKSNSGNVGKGKLNNADGVMNVCVNGVPRKVRFPETFKNAVVTIPISIRKGDTFSIESIPGMDSIYLDYIDFYTSEKMDAIITVSEIPQVLSATSHPSGSYVVYEAEYEYNMNSDIVTHKFFSNEVDLVAEPVVVGSVSDRDYITFYHCPASDVLGIAYYEMYASDPFSQLSIYVNGIKKGMIRFPKEGGAYVMDNTWVNISIPEDATITLQHDIDDESDINIDYLKFYGEGLSSQEAMHAKHAEYLEEMKVEIIIEEDNSSVGDNSLRMEAEDALLKNLVINDFYVENVIENASIIFKDIPESSGYTMRVMVKSKNAITPSLNGVKATGVNIYDDTFGTFVKYEVETYIPEASTLEFILRSYLTTSMVSIDYVDFHKPVGAKGTVSEGGNIRYEAEDALIVDARINKTNIAFGYGVGNYVEFLDLPKSKKIVIGYTAPWERTPEMILYINNKRVKIIKFSQTEDWDNTVEKTINCVIVAGDSVKLEFIKGQTSINIDYIESVPNN